MSFTIVLKQNLSDANALDKTFSEDTITLTGTLREKTSLQDPVITVEIDSTQLSDFAKMNYAVISEFGRSYFITKAPTALANGLWELTMHVDVLTSFKSEIRNNYAIVARNEKHFDLRINDGEFRVLQNPFIKTIKFPESPFQTIGAYVLITAGGASE